MWIFEDFSIFEGVYVWLLFFVVTKQGHLRKTETTEKNTGEFL